MFNVFPSLYIFSNNFRSVLLSALSHGFCKIGEYTNMHSFGGSVIYYFFNFMLLCTTPWIFIFNLIFVDNKYLVINFSSLLWFLKMMWLFFKVFSNPEVCWFIFFRMTFLHFGGIYQNYFLPKLTFMPINILSYKILIFILTLLK